MNPIPQPRSDASRNERLCAFALLAAVFAVYAACALVPYPLCDDYGQMIYLQNGWTNWITNPLSRDGRPFTSAFICGGFRVVGDLDHLMLLRAVAFAGAMGFALYLYRQFLRIGFDCWNALALCFVIVLAPGVGEYVGWTVSWPFMPLLIAVAWMSARFSEGVENASLIRIAAYGLSAIAGLQLVMLTYQPIAGFFIVIPFLMLARGRTRPALVGIPVLAAAFGVYRFILFPGLNLLISGWCQPGRAGLDGSLCEHLARIIREFSLFVASGWTSLLLPRGGWMIVGCAVLVLALVGCLVIASRWCGRKYFLALALAFAALAISAPQVFLLGDIWAFRTHYPMAVVVGIMAWLGLAALARRRVAVLSAAVCAAIFLCAMWAVNVGIVYSSRREYVITRTMLEDLKRSGARTAYVLIAPDLLALLLRLYFADSDEPVAGRGRGARRVAGCGDSARFHVYKGRQRLGNPARRQPGDRPLGRGFGSPCGAVSRSALANAVVFPVSRTNSNQGIFYDDSGQIQRYCRQLREPAQADHPVHRRLLRCAVANVGL